MEWAWNLGGIWVERVSVRNHSPFLVVFRNVPGPLGAALERLGPLDDGASV
ncbi:MAG: hypothetical protein RLZZ450_2728 [Pseudomonadota bacterium]|jgi:hypothetical protein